MRKTDVAIRHCQKTCKSKSLSHQSRLRHFRVVIKPECLYAAEIVVSKTFPKIEKKERKFFGTHKIAANTKLTFFMETKTIAVSKLWEKTNDFLPTP